MSESYYECAVCNLSFPGHRVKDCEKCNEDVCMDCIINIPDDIGFERNSAFDDKEFRQLLNEDSYLGLKHCPLCSGNEVSDWNILSWLLEKTGLTFDEVKEAILKERNGD